MREQAADLNLLIKKYKSILENLERQINETKEKMNVAYGALKLLEQEKLLQPTKSLSDADTSGLITESLSEKYKGMGLNKAILDILLNSDKYLDGHDIYDELIKNGFTSSSSNIKRDVYIALYRLNKENKINSKKYGNRKKYNMIKQNI